MPLAPVLASVFSDVAGVMLTSKICASHDAFYTIPTQFEQRRWD
jgi:hypothetical protein